MVKYTKRNVNVDQEILEFISKTEKCKFTDITTNERLSDIRSKSTLEKRVTFLKENDILQKKEGNYRVNPYISDYSKAYKQQINEGEKSETNHNRLLEISFFKEKELRDRITRPETTYFSKDFGTLTNELFLSNECNLFFSDIFYSFLREGIIFNPELWEKLIKPTHFNFEFKMKCTWEKDPKIFILINELKEIYKKIEYIPHNINSPFHRKEIIKLNSKSNDKHYMNAVFQETIRTLTGKKTKKYSKEFQGKVDALLISFKPFLKEIEDFTDLKDLPHIINLLLSLRTDKLKNPTIEERQELSEKFINSLETIRSKVFSFLEIED